MAKASGSKGGIKDLRTVNTEYGAFLAEVRSFHWDRDAEVIRLREVESNCSFWSDQLHMPEQLEYIFVGWLSLYKDRWLFYLLM